MKRQEIQSVLLTFIATLFFTTALFAEPVPDLKLYESDTVQNVPVGNVPDIKVALNPGTDSGAAADWWLVYTGPGGVYYYDLTNGWISASSDLNMLSTTYSGGLFQLDSTKIPAPDTSVLGYYVFYFGVDLTVNGSLDLDTLYYDSVPLNIMTFYTTAFEYNATIPQKYTCDGDNVSPYLAWKGIPAEAKSLAIVMDDPDAPGGTFTHWTIFDIPIETTELVEGYTPSGNVKEGVTSFGTTGYSGPCPPSGPAHRYIFKLFALDTETLGLSSGASITDVESALESRLLPGFPIEYTGYYSR